MAGIYIHIPFCKQACSYCNFHFSTSFSLREKLIDALKNEIDRSGDFISQAEPIETIYFGGGTPSILTQYELGEILEALYKKFSIIPGAETTLEANPDDINPSSLKYWKDMGINRFSLGIQSFNDEELAWMNRAHNAADSLRSIHEIQQAGFANFSVDLIFGSPFLSDSALKENLNIIFKHGIPHISCYALTVETGTALKKKIEKHLSPPVNSEIQAEQFLLLMNEMSNAGYEHYEISNFALPGMRSQHNSSYWKGKAYHGFGPAAHSYNSINERRWNIANNALYIQMINQHQKHYEAEILTTEQRLNEYIMTSLRLMEGIDIEFINTAYGKKFTDIIEEGVSNYIDTGKMIRKNQHWILTNEGKLFADGIAADLFF